MWFGSYDKRVYCLQGNLEAELPHLTPCMGCHRASAHAQLDGSVTAAVVLHPTRPRTVFVCTTGGSVACVCVVSERVEDDPPPRTLCPTCGKVGEPGPVGALHPLWVRKLGGPVFGTPAVVRGSRRRGRGGGAGPEDGAEVDLVLLLVPCADGSLYCMDTGSGAVQWSYATGAPLFSTPLVLETVGSGGQSVEVGAACSPGFPLNNPQSPAFKLNRTSFPLSPYVR